MGLQSPASGTELTFPRAASSAINALSPGERSRSTVTKPRKRAPLEPVMRTSCNVKAYERPASRRGRRRVGQIAYVIVFMSGDVVPEELAVARAAATRANELAKGERPGILDTLARVHFLSDELELALEVQAQAVALARDDGEKRELERHLHEYENARDG